MTTTTFDPAAALVALADSLPAGRTAQYASKIEQARQGTLPQAHAAMILRQLGGMSSPAECETPHRLPSNPSGSNASSHRANPASEAQVRFVTRLVATKVGGQEYAAEVAKGLSKNRASAIIDILTGRADAVVDESNCATPAQLRFLNSLRVERGSEELTTEAAARLSRKQASAEIEAWKLIPRPTVARQVAAAKEELEDGIYRVGDDWFKVVHAVHGSGRQYAKRLVVDGPGSAHFERAAGALRNITADHKATLEEAKQFGAVYGVCCSCGATLTDEESIAAGIGPVCAKKF